MTCLRIVLKGRLQLGSLEIPVSGAVVLSGGVTSRQTFVFNGHGGLTRAAQVVPAGLIGLTGLPWLGEFLSPKEQAVVAVLEMPVGTTQASTSGGTELRVHLVNPTLGAYCYIGTSTGPIPVDLDGSAQSAPGIPDERGITKEAAEVTDESLAVPAPSGCVLNLFGFVPVSINGLIDAQSSLSSETGSAELSIEREMVPRSRVYG